MKGGPSMKKILGLCTAAALCVALAAGAAQAGNSRRNVVDIKLATYVWQPTTVKATNAIVAAWNKSHPAIQVSVVPVDVNAVHDKLLTSFVGGTASDIIHDEAADIAGFYQQGYLANLTPLIPRTLKSSIPKSVWDTTNYGGKIGGVPIMLQTYNVFANMDILKKAGIKAPTVRKPWSWTQFRAIAKKLSTDGNYGVCWGLRSPTATIQTLSLNWGGQWNYLENGKWILKVGAGEKAILNLMHGMIYDDKSIDAAGVGLSGSAVLPAFFAGKCAMTVQGNYSAQSMIEQAPKGFNWAMFPPLKGASKSQVANPQTYSISQQSQHKKEAMQFIAYALNAQNMAKLAAGDWLIPAAPAAAKIVVKTTKHYGSWRNAVSAVPDFRKGNWVSINAYPRWKAEIATPAFRQYLGNQITMDQLTTTLVNGWNSVRG
jgi:ABC-type glycerol-3-phosphate transport system substrate-binding protein